ncbi:MAG TPA: substrate-binding domain-containing protein [Polyangiaceae bacterium]|jgi:D-xylose transport system substrate-binding protein|nr:substrate-binding domain-containing protein [Polyangiaceae bacterium]
MSVKSFLVVASLALSVLIGLVLGRGGESQTQTAVAGPHTIKIGLSMDTLKEARWAKDRDAFVNRAKELGAEVTVLSANGDDTRQVADVESLITAKVDVIVIVPHDGKAMAKGVEVAHKAGIPVIAYDRLIVDSDLDVYVTFDNEHVGELQAQFILNALKDGPKPIKMLRIYGSKTDNNAFLFKAGQDKALKDAIANGTVEVVHEDWADDWKPENAKRIANAALTKFPKGIQAVLASNDGTAGGAIQALREEGGASGIIVTGQDAELVAVQRIVGGEQSMTIYKPVQELAKQAADTAVALAKGKTLIATQTTDNGKIKVPTILHDVVTVTKDNIDSTLIKDGFLTHDEVYGAGAAPAASK